MDVGMVRMCSRTSAAGGSAASRNSPGRTKGAPYTNSAEEMLLSSLGAALRPNRTHGKWALWVVCRPGGVLHAQLAAEGLPDGRGELGSPVRSDESGDAEPGHPAADQGVRAGGGGHVPERDGF
jgi:hypothetical protein